MADRPLSPHLQVYRLPLLPLVSILTRASAVALSLGVLVFAAWLITLGLGEGPYARMTGLLTSPLGIFMLMCWTFALMWHSANGIRHLFWDAGYGFERGFATKTGVITLVVAGALTLLYWLGALA